MDARPPGPFQEEVNPVVQAALRWELHRFLEDVGELGDEERQEVDGGQRVHARQ